MTTSDTATDAPRAPGPRRRRWPRRVAWGVLALVVLFGLIQLVPYGHAKNPPVTKAAGWPDPQAQAIAVAACYDCHSNLSKRWWGTKIAPFSWLAQNDENGGRSALNFSEWDKPQADLQDAIETVQSGSMPPWFYKLFHGNARLSSADKQKLVAGLTALYATDPPAGTKHGGG